MRGREWVNHHYQKWGCEIAQERLSVRKTAAKYGISRSRAHALICMVKEKGAPVRSINPGEAEDNSFEDDSWVHSSRYYRDEENDVYVTFLRKATKPLVVPGDQHRAMKREYSNWDGDPASVNEICRKYSIPRAWFIEYKGIHGWTHDSEPFSDEEIVERPQEALVNDALQLKRRALSKKWEKERWKQVEKSALKWERFEAEVLDRLVEAVEKTDPKHQVPKLVLPRAKRKYSVVMSATDFHWGMYSWGKETGDAYNQEVAYRRLSETTQDLVDRLPGQPDEFILAVGSDWFHIDGDTNSTTMSTPQDVHGSPAEILITGCQVARDHIDFLRQTAPVKVVLMAGNHDRCNALTLFMYLRAWYKDCDDVEIINDIKPRVYLTYGNTLLGFHHGDGTPVNRLGPCMAQEAREQWGKTRHHVFFGGHLHHEVLKEINGIKHYQMPSLAGTDRWHTRKGYVDCVPGLAAYLVDYEKGITATLFSPAD